jgi:hypothetical protein
MRSKEIGVVEGSSISFQEKKRDAGVGDWDGGRIGRGEFEDPRVDGERWS